MTNILNHKVLGQGSSLIIMHGLFGSLDNWITLAKQFAQTRQVILVDLRNHGKSFHSSQMNFDLMSADVVKLMSHLGISTASILGHSMGGKVAMQMAAKHQNSVETLIVADISPRKYQSRHNEIINALQSLNPAELTSRNEADEQLMQKIESFGVRQFLLKNLSRTKDGSFEWRMNLKGIVANYENIIDAVALEPTFEWPTLFLKGENSNYILESDETEIWNSYPNAEIEEISHAGHWLHADNPAAFYKITEKFLTQNVL
ncbi:MAG: alpha/beta fold hydrolase [Bacteroidetes bacterium]|nr:alpha/beta fold hydrolase [Bacteroidota bacterium]